MGLLAMLHALTAAPASILGLEAGRLARGAPADLVLLDLEAEWTVTERGLLSLAKNTAFEGRKVRGRVLRTWVDGRSVFEAPG
jgi:dihydroorotase